MSRALAAKPLVTGSIPS